MIFSVAELVIAFITCQKAESSRKFKQHRRAGKTMNVWLPACTRWMSCSNDGADNGAERKVSRAAARNLKFLVKGVNLGANCGACACGH